MRNERDTPFKHCFAMAPRRANNKFIFNKEKYRVDRNIHIIPTGIEIERFYKENFKRDEISKLRKKVDISSRDKILTFVGRLGKEKSVDFLIDCHKDIIKKNPNTKLLIIGDGPEMGDFVNQVKKLKIEKSVIFTGKVPLEEIPLYYQLSDIFVTASTTETQGLTVIEAMGASIPVVCIDDDSFKIAVVDDLNGYFFKNKKEYVCIINKLLDDSKLLKRLSNQARVTSELHSAKYFAEKVLQVYKIAISNKSKDSKLTRTIKRVVRKVLHGEK